MAAADVICSAIDTLADSWLCMSYPYLWWALSCLTGRQVHRRGDAALHWAAFRGDLAATEALHAMGANVVCPPWSRASSMAATNKPLACNCCLARATSTVFNAPAPNYSARCSHWVEGPDTLEGHSVWEPYRAVEAGCPPCIRAQDSTKYGCNTSHLTLLTQRALPRMWKGTWATGLCTWPLHRATGVCAACCSAAELQW